MLFNDQFLRKKYQYPNQSCHYSYFFNLINLTFQSDILKKHILIKRVVTLTMMSLFCVNYNNFKGLFFSLEVFTELKAIDSSTPAYITVSCMCGSLGCLLIVTYVGIYIETVKSLVESLVINLLLILNTSALLFDFVALTSYSYLYHTKLKKTTLQKEEILGGFSSKTELEQSFWLCSSSPIFIVLNMIYILVLCRTQANRTTRRDVSNSSTSWKKGDNMRSPMIY
ncbi:uncharacterized protein LOC130644661 isoform X2 [Hydractinia symbiolongicarpus]|uniref:uncharacterized protein LOC130644661 isoform X2 n=1 Tax=Hydractinia symbiolongicarpus TaxID=13093 RepID=UPI002550EE1C|nr:uncharacterized protein LOC130644661 isoform X2 [Hydractinia symbiolongicarpus]